MATTRGKYTRPCDACAVRKVRCNTQNPCDRCIAHKIICSYDRPRRKSGPKRLREKTRAQVDALAKQVAVMVDHSVEPKFTPEQLLPFLHLYQTYYYGIYPVVLVPELSVRILAVPSDMTAYTLAVSIAAAVSIQIQFLTSPPTLLVVPDGFDPIKFGIETKQMIYQLDLNGTPLVDAVLIYFFMYVHLINVKGGISAGIAYLRQAIATAQILRLDVESTYAQLTPARAHVLRKVFYLLLVTERFISISHRMPPILESMIAHPRLADEEYQQLLNGFGELVKVFSIPHKLFFDLIIQYGVGLKELRRQWVIDVQFQLQLIEVSDDMSETQKLNLLLLKYWMEMLCWHMCNRQGILVDKTHGFDLLLVLFPIHVAYSFLEDTSSLSLFAFESNGPGVCIKLCELGIGLCDLISLLHDDESHTRNIAHHCLLLIFSLVTRLRNDLTFPNHLYQRIDAMVTHGLSFGVEESTFF